MMNYPTFYCPFPSAINPHVGVAQQRALQWVIDTQLATPRSRTFQLLETAKFGWLAARAFPHATLNDLTLVAQWLIWSFLHHDLSDALNSNQAMAKMDERFYDVLSGMSSRPGDTPLTLALANLRQQLTLRTSETWLTRFAQNVDIHFESHLWEATGRQYGIPPRLDNYINLCGHTAGGYVIFDWLLLTLRIDPTAEFLRHGAIRELARKAATIIAWHNDIFAVEQDLADDNPNNLVLLLQEEHDLSLDCAIEEVIVRANAEMNAFVKLADSIRHLTKHDEQCQAYVTGIGNAVRAHLDWLTNRMNSISERENLFTTGFDSASQFIGEREMALA